MNGFKQRSVLSYIMPPNFRKNILGAFLDFTCGMAACSWPHGAFSLAQASRAWIRDLIREPLGADSLIREPMGADFSLLDSTVGKRWRHRLTLYVGDVRFLVTWWPTYATL